MISACSNINLELKRDTTLWLKPFFQCNFSETAGKTEPIVGITQIKAKLAVETVPVPLYAWYFDHTNSLSYTSKIFRLDIIWAVLHQDMLWELAFGRNNEYFPNLFKKLH